MPRALAPILLGALALAGAACGFRLQGTAPLPADVDAVRVVHEQPYGVAAPPLVLILEQRLRSRGALGDPGADAVLRISRLDTQRRVLAVSPQDARGAVYELESTVEFDFRVRGETRLAHESLTVRREYSVDNTARLASETERTDLEHSMQAELADLILLRLEAAGAAQ